ncbi:50S ribosomal protein L16 [Candidatus Nomurabacteria bacterium]|jgi:large subunit ribosomal protein L16|nr:MAG: 50S ribosomal protein L16 [Candidatus Nomurabacteria bacterium]
MLLPKKVKYRKWQRARKDMDSLTPDTRGITLSFGSFGLKALAAAQIKSNQLESARKAMTRALGKGGRVWIRIFPDRPITAKPAEVGMGKGKGDLQGYCFEVRPGRIIFEIDGVDAVVAKEALRKAGTKLPVKTKVIAR